MDASQSPASDTALREARDRGAVVVSRAYYLTRDQHLPEAHRQLSFVAVAPVYSPPDASGERAYAQPRGYIRR